MTFPRYYSHRSKCSRNHPVAGPCDDGVHKHVWVEIKDRGVVIKVVCTGWGCTKQRWEVD